MATGPTAGTDRTQRTRGCAWRALAGGALAMVLLATPAAACADAASRDAALQSMVDALAQASVFDRLRAVNRFFNRFTYRSDRELWGREDHWASPAELIERGAGDCEDLAIAKYFTLRRLGFAVSSLRLTYVREMRTGRSHMVLLYLRPGADALVLDSLEERLRPLAAHADLVPVYGLNEERVTVSVPGGGERSFPHAGRWVVRKWQSLLARAQARLAPVARADALAPPAAMLLAAAPQFQN